MLDASEQSDVKNYILAHNPVIGKTGIPLPIWLARIKFSKMNIVTSFHGVVFSIIFKKNFIAISHEINDDRITCLLNKLGLEDRLIKSFSDINMKLLTTNIDYTIVNKKLISLQRSSYEFLRTAMLGALKEKFL